MTSIFVRSIPQKRPLFFTTGTFFGSFGHIIIASIRKTYEAGPFKENLFFSGGWSVRVCGFDAATATLWMIWIFIFLDLFLR